ncbi:MAG: transcription factor TFIIIB subunit brf1 [Marteilia pararefringens]
MDDQSDLLHSTTPQINNSSGSGKRQPNSETCDSCGSSEFVTDSAKGDSVCTQCGTVQTKHSGSFLVSTIDFQEANNGSKQAIGQFVGSDGYFASRHMSGVGLYLSGRESKQMTFSNAKRSIEDIAIPMKLPSHIIDMAFNFYKMCYNRNLTRGRKLRILCAACLYLSCRLELTSHMLVDFSQSIQTDMASILKYFSLVAKSLGIQIPLIDPCLYIPRFAEKLELGNKTNGVVEVAINLISGMQRDWMATGRRPSGLCAASLLISSRLHGFHRTVDDVMRIFKLHKSTLLKRLTEFSKIPTGSMKYDEMLSSNDDMSYKSESISTSEANHSLGFERALKLDPKKLIKLQNNMIELRNEIDKLVEKNIAPKPESNKSKSKKKGIDDENDEKNLNILENYCTNIDLIKEDVLSDLDDSEIENCLLSEHEISNRKEILREIGGIEDDNDDDVGNNVDGSIPELLPVELYDAENNKILLSNDINATNSTAPDKLFPLTSNIENKQDDLVQLAQIDAKPIRSEFDESYDALSDDLSGEDDSTAYNKNFTNPFLYNE